MARSAQNAITGISNYHFNFLQMSDQTGNQTIRLAISPYK